MIKVINSSDLKTDVDMVCSSCGRDHGLSSSKYGTYKEGEDYVFETDVSDGREWCICKECKIRHDTKEHESANEKLRFDDWVLCVMQSPQEGQKVLLTFKNKAGLHVGEATFKNDAYYYEAYTDEGHYEEQYGVPVAWMHKPEPYNFNDKTIGDKAYE